MRILRIRLADYRGTVEREVRFGPGVTVIEGPNEAGKSSLAEALDLLLDCPDNARSQRVREVFPVDRDASPEVEADIETGEYAFTYRKRWGRGARTELRIDRPQRESVTGREAHDRATGILAKTLDLGLWRAIRIEQGEGVEQAALADSQALARALDAASGGSGSGEQEAALLERVEEVYRTYYTAGGRPTGELARCEARLDEARTRVRELDARERALERDVEESARIASRLRGLDEAQPARVAELARCEEEGQRVEALRRELAAGEAARERARAAEQEAAREHTERGARVQRAEELAAKVSELAARAKDGGAALGDLSLRLETAQRSAAGARAATEAAAAALQRAQADVELRRTELEATQLAERLARLREQQERLREAERALASNGVTREVLRELQAAEAARAHAHARLEDGGPRVALRALAAVTVEVDDTTLALAAGDEDLRAATRPTRIRLPSQLEIEVRPGASLDDLDARARETDERWSALAARYGVDELEAATRAHVARESALRTRDEAAERIREALRDLTPEALEAKAGRSRAAAESYLAKRGPEPPLPATLDDAKAALARAEAERDAARRALEVEDAALEATRVGHAGRREEQARLETQLEMERVTLAAEAEVLELARAERPDDVLAAALEASRRQRETADAALAERARQLEALGPEAVAARLASARAAVAQVQQERQELEVARAGMKARLEVQQEEGLFEQREAARTELAHAEREVASLVRRAAAARRLFETLVRHRDAARQRYREPLRARIRELGRVVFGSGFDVALGEDLAIATRTLDDVTVAYEQLSTGAQEQLGFLARLAAAMLVAPQEGVPLLVDDALGYSDPSRIAAMNAALGVAAAQCQVIVLTCWPERFRGVPGARIERVLPG